MLGFLVALFQDAAGYTQLFFDFFFSKEIYRHSYRYFGWGEGGGGGGGEEGGKDDFTFNSGSRTEFSSECERNVDCQCDFPVLDSNDLIDCETSIHDQRTYIANNRIRLDINTVSIKDYLHSASENILQHCCFVITSIAHNDGCSKHVSASVIFSLALKKNTQ